MPLWAVDGDPNSHGNGQLSAGSPKTVFVNNKNVTYHPNSAASDNKDHTNTGTKSGSSSVFVYGKPVHRDGDPRQCGATTTVTNQSTVFVG